MQIFNPQDLRGIYDYTNKYLGYMCTSRDRSFLSVSSIMGGFSGTTGGKYNIGFSNRNINCHTPVLKTDGFYYGVHSEMSLSGDPIDGRQTVAGRIAVTKHKNKIVFQGGWRYGTIWGTVLDFCIWQNCKGKKFRSFTQRVPDMWPMVTDPDTAFFYGCVACLRDMLAMQRTESVLGFLGKDTDHYAGSAENQKRVNAEAQQARQEIQSQNLANRAITPGSAEANAQTYNPNLIQQHR